MKKMLAIVLSLLLMMGPLGALAEVTFDDDGATGLGSMGEEEVEVGDGTEGEEAVEGYVWEEIPDESMRISTEEFGEFVVGATTKLNGDFFTNMWGNNTCDIDVRSMVHGYDTIFWNKQSSFSPNLTVVADMSADPLEDGGKMYTLQIHSDLTYNDGSPITAKDYLFSLMLHGAPQIKEIDGMTTNVGYIVGYDDFNAGTTPYFSGLRLIDDYTFSITIKPEYLPFFFEMGMLDAIPYPIAVIAPGCEVVDNGEGAQIENIDKTIEEPIFTAELLRETILNPETGYMSHPYVSSGPYKLTSFDWETRIARFEINPYFKGDWDGYKPTIDNVVFKSVLPVEMIEELKRGDVHLLNKVVSGDDIMAGVNAGDEIQSVPYSRLGFGFVSFSCEEGPTQFEAVREAIAYCTDVTEFCTRYSKGYGMEVYGYYGLAQWMVQLLLSVPMTEYDPADPEGALWQELSIDNLLKYEFDVEQAKQLLIEDGWTLNEKGEAFVEGTDTARCKMVDGELMPLVLQWGKMKDSVAADILEELIIEPLAQAGIVVEVTVVPFVELLEHYYRQRERTYDMMYLATNFISIFDPYFVFNTRDEYQGHQNTTGYRDAALEALALNLRRTEPGALLEYCQKWLAFQTYFNDKLPMLPLYGNIYYDFFTQYLQNYHPDREEMKNWPVALVRSYLANPVDSDNITVADTEELAATVDGIDPNTIFSEQDRMQFEVPEGNWLVGNNLPEGTYSVEKVGETVAQFVVDGATNGDVAYDAPVEPTITDMTVMDGAKIAITGGSVLFKLQTP